MRSSIPDGDLAAVIEDAVSEKLARLEARRFAKTAAPRKSVGDTSTAPRSRYVPAPVRRAVYERDGGRCAFVDEQGRRCSARDHLEFHHRHPFGYGGEHDPENLSLVCRVHNAYLAEIDYGKERMRSRFGAASHGDSTLGAEWGQCECRGQPFFRPGSRFARRTTTPPSGGKSNFTRSANWRMK